MHIWQSRFFLLYIVLHVLSDDVSAEVASLRVSDESVHLVTKIHLTKIQSTHYSYKTRKTTLFLFYNDQWRQKQIEGGGGLDLLKKNLDKQKQGNLLA